MPQAARRRAPDPGLFGPGSVSWQVHSETTVLFGGARALLMQAAHPLVVAGARNTDLYRRNPWRRLERTLHLTYAITFGTTDEALRAAERINEVHRRVKGVDEVTGLAYDALDPELLLWVHACLVDSALTFERYTVGRLDGRGRQRFHEEQMVVAELLGLPRSRIPPTVAALRAYVLDTVAGGGLQVTPAAREVARLFRRPPPEAQYRTLLRAVSWWAFGSLPPTLRREYGVRWDPAREAALRATLLSLRGIRRLAPARLRWILPSQLARARLGAAVDVPPGAAG